MAAAAAAPPSRAFEFPIEIRSESSRQQHKQKSQRENPETLFKDCSSLNGRRTTTNLLFHTERSTAWHSAIRRHFTHTTKRGICKEPLAECESAEAHSPAPTPEPLQAERETEPPHHPTVTVQHSAPSANTAPPPSPRLHSTVAEIRNSLSLLEVELVELREHIHTLISTSTDMRFLRDQLSLTTDQLQELKGDMENLRQEKEALKNELTNVRVNTTKELEQVKQELKRETVSLKDELHQRDTTIKTLKTQMETPTKQLNTPHTAPQPSPSTSQPSNTQNLPITQQDHPEPPSETPRTLKDVAQGRRSYSVEQHRAESLKPQHHHHRYTAISPVVYKHHLRARHLPGQRSPPQPTLRAPPTGPVHPATPSRPALRPHLTTSARNISSGLAQRPPPTRPAHQHQSGPTPRAAPLSQDSVLQQQRSYAEALQTPQNSTQMGEIKQLLQYICTKLT
ncbi:hypothetical protein MHYP_G00264220 [Metynnis hypsauchen]